MFGAFDTYTAQGLATIFGDVLNNGMEDIIFQPPDNAIEFRKSERGDYDFPFISMWRGPGNLDSDQFNMAMACDGINVMLPGDDPEVDDSVHIKLLPVQLTYSVTYWDGQNLPRANLFNFEWLLHTRQKAKIDVEFPFETSQGNKSDTFTFQQQYQFSEELTDNSGIERRFESGAMFRYDGELVTTGYVFASPTEQTLIRDITLNFFLERMTNETLVRQLLIDDSGITFN